MTILGEAFRRAPLAARVLGLAGVIPFAVCSASLAGLDFWPEDRTWHALLAYGAVILSFLGAVHWGCAIAPGSDNETRLWSALGLSVVPALGAWCLLVFTPPPAAALALLMLAFGGQFAADRAHAYLLPGWYLNLRRILTILVIAALGVAFAFSPITGIGR